jgi:hypothetical protein
MFAEWFQMQVTVLVLGPVVVSLDLTALLLSREHNDDTGILLPHYLPEVLCNVSKLSVIHTDANVP